MSPTLYIIRGLPGSGKSTLAKQIVHPDYHREADMFFMNYGKYEFNPSKIKDAHEWCYNEVERLMKDKHFYNIAVSNTFTRRWEYQKYIDLAEENNYKVMIIECHGNFGSIHNVPKEVYNNMKNRWETTNG